MEKIAVAGAGIAGLSTAWHLQKDGFETVVFEAGHKPGGRMVTESFDGFFMDAGASFITSLYTKTLQVADELGMSGEVKPVYHSNFVIKRDGDFHELKPASLLSAIKFTGVSLREKLSLVKLVPPILLNFTKLDMHHLEKGLSLDDQSVYDYFERLCGKEACESLIDTAMSSFFLYSSRELSRLLGLMFMRYFLSLKVLCFEHGMGSFSDRLARELTTYYDSPVRRISEKGDQIQVEVDKDGQRDIMDFDAVVVAVQGDLVPEIVEDLSPADREFFQSIEYSKTYVVGLKSSVPLTETFFPIFIPAKESSIAALMMLEDSKDPTRIPAGKGLLQVFTRDKWSKDFQGNLDEAGEIISHEAERIYPPIKGNITGFKVFLWERAVDKFPAGIYGKIDKFWKERNPKSRLFYAGAYLQTPGIEAALETGQRAARAVSIHFPH